MTTGSGREGTRGWGKTGRESCCLIVAQFLYERADKLRGMDSGDDCTIL